jgi:MFS family permease
MAHDYHAVRFALQLYIPTLTKIYSAWAICTIGMGFVKDFKDLVIVRALLGVCEGGLFPGVTYYITMW